MKKKEYKKPMIEQVEMENTFSILETSIGTSEKPADGNYKPLSLDEDEVEEDGVLPKAVEMW